MTTPLQATALALGAALAMHANAAAIKYDVKDLGTLPGRASFPTAINSDAQVLGQSNGQGQDGILGSFATGPQGEDMRDPCPADALSCTPSGIDDSGRVALTIVKTGQHGFGVSHVGFASVDGSGLRYMTGTLDGAPPSVQGLSRHGMITGAGWPAAGGYQAFVSARAGKVLQGLATPGFNSEGRAVNDAGQVAGFGAVADSDNVHAMFAPGDGSPMQDLGTFDGGYSVATAISDSGYIVGYASIGDVGDGVVHAMLARAGTPGLTDLGTLGGATSTAFGVNDDGVVVGTSAVAAGISHAFVLHAKDGHMVDLNKVTDLPKGIVLTEADAINGHGQIAASASDAHVYLLTPR